MLAIAPAYGSGVAAYKPLIDLLGDILVTPADLCRHWGFSEEHLCNLRKRNRGVPFVRLPTGGIRYRAAEVIGAELRGTEGPITVERMCLAASACASVSEKDRAAMIAHLRAAFESGA